QGIGQGQPHVAIRAPLVERPPDVGHPLIHIPFAAGEAEAALATARHACLFQAMWAQIRRIARLQSATAEHVVDDGLHMTILVPWMALLAGLPVSAAALLEGVFVDPLPCGCHSAWLSHVLAAEASGSSPSSASRYPAPPQESRAEEEILKKDILLRCT